MNAVLSCGLPAYRFEIIESLVDELREQGRLLETLHRIPPRSLADAELSQGLKQAPARWDFSSFSKIEGKLNMPPVEGKQIERFLESFSMLTGLAMGMLQESKRQDLLKQLKPHTGFVLVEGRWA